MAGPTREDRALIPGSDARPADALIPTWSGGKDSARHNCGKPPAGEGCRRTAMVFLLVETLWGWHDQTVAQVKRLGSALAKQTGQDES